MEDMEHVLLTCPGCQESLKQTDYLGGWYHEICTNHNCTLKYENFSIDNSNGFLKFRLKDFYVYVYIDFMERKDEIIIHPMKVSRQTQTEPQTFTIPRFQIDWKKLDDYNERWKMWRVFS